MPKAFRIVISATALAVAVIAISAAVSFAICWLAGVDTSEFFKQGGFSGYLQGIATVLAATFAAVVFRNWSEQEYGKLRSDTARQILKCLFRAQMAVVACRSKIRQQLWATDEYARLAAFLEGEELGTLADEADARIEELKLFFLEAELLFGRPVRDALAAYCILWGRFNTAFPRVCELFNEMAENPEAAPAIWAKQESTNFAFVGIRVKSVMQVPDIFIEQLNKHRTTLQSLLLEHLKFGEGAYAAKL